MRQNTNLRLIGLALLATSTVWCACAQTLQWIYDPTDPNSRHAVWGFSVTPDGRYVVGVCVSIRENYDTNRRLPYLWDRMNQSFQFYPSFCGGAGVQARDVAYVNGDYGANDLTVVGGTPGNFFYLPFVWSQNGGCHSVSSGNWGYAYSVAEDYIFAGTDYSDANVPKAVIWGSSFPSPGLYRKVLQSNPSEALAIAKRNSSTVVGWANNPSGRRQAVVWKHTGVRNALPTVQHFLPYPSQWTTLRGSAANAVSPNGRVILGNASGWIEDRSDPEFPTSTPVSAILVWRWDGQNPGTITLEEIRTSPLSSNASTALGITTDGDRIVGYRNIPVGSGSNQRIEPRAAWWRKTNSGWVHEDLNQVFSNLIGTGSVLLVANAISPDGRYIVGWGYNAARGRQEAFLLSLPCVSHLGDVNNDGCVNDADLLEVLFAFGRTGSNLGRADVDCSGRVDDADLLTVLFNFGSGC